MIRTVTKQYGPFVHCTFTGDIASTHRPANSGPFYCMNCGETDHEVEGTRNGAQTSDATNLTPAAEMS